VRGKRFVLVIVHLHGVKRILNGQCYIGDELLRVSCFRYSINRAYSAVLSRECNGRKNDKPLGQQWLQGFASFQKRKVNQLDNHAGHFLGRISPPLPRARCVES